MHLRLFIFLFGACFLGYTHAAVETGSPSFWQPSKDDIYIDDEELEGSGQGRRDGKDDLESSGSGYGPPENGPEDDEDRDSGSGDATPIVPYVPKGEGKSNKGDSSSPDVGQNKVPPVNVDLPAPGVVKPGGADGDLTGAGSQDVDAPRRGNGDYVMSTKQEERTTSFFAQPGILAAVIGGAVVGLLCAILVVMFIVYRMRKKDEGSYALDEPKRSPTVNSYTKNSSREFYA